MVTSLICLALPFPESQNHRMYMPKGQLAPLSLSAHGGEEEADKDDSSHAWAQDTEAGQALTGGPRLGGSLKLRKEEDLHFLFP